MSIIHETLQLADIVAAQIEFPGVSRLYLPRPNTDPEIRDEFGLIFLEGGVVAPFYASLPGALETLWQTFPAANSIQVSLHELIRMYGDPDPAFNAIALGAFNAMSQFIMQQAKLLPLNSPAGANMGSAKPQAGELIGMVGYFCPLIDKLLERGVRVRVLERQPQRVELRPGLSLCEDPAELADCRIVLCTAATLINDSVDEILTHCRGAENFSLIGPSGSGLPDILFARGVDSVGGVYFPDQAQLDERLRERDSWGDAGQKYQLSPDNYPGYQALLDSIKTRR